MNFVVHGVSKLMLTGVKEVSSKKEQELTKLQRDWTAHVVVAGKLTTEQSDWLAQEISRKQETCRKILCSAVSKRLAAVTDKKAKQKRLVESEVTYRNLKILIHNHFDIC